MSKSVKVLRDQKEEYTEHLFELLNQPLINVYRNIYNDVLKSKECTKKNVLKLFQKQMETTPEWNQTKIKKVYADILAENKCSYFPELIKTVYMLTLKIVLLGIPSEKRKKIQIRIPSPESFVHRCLVHVARELWKRPYLLYHESRSIDCQQNMHECELIIRKKLKAVIRETIPLEWVINEFDNINSGETLPEPLSESEAEEEPVAGEENEAGEAEEEDSEAESGDEDSEEESGEEESGEEESGEEDSEEESGEEEDSEDESGEEEDSEEESGEEDSEEDSEDESGEEEESEAESGEEEEAPVPEPEIVIAEAPVPEPEIVAEAPVPEPEIVAEAPVPVPEPEIVAEAPVPEPIEEAPVPEPELKEDEREIIIETIKKKKKSQPVNAFF